MNSAPPETVTVFLCDGERPQPFKIPASVPSGNGMFDHSIRDRAFVRSPRICNEIRDIAAAACSASAWLDRIERDHVK